MPLYRFWSSVSKYCTGVIFTRVHTQCDRFSWAVVSLKYDITAYQRPWLDASISEGTKTNYGALLVLGLRLADRRRQRADGRKTCAFSGAPLGEARKTRVKQETERSGLCPTIMPCTPGTAPQRFESLYIAGNCEKGH